jgi:hypothetical protein
MVFTDGGMDVLTGRAAQMCYLDPDLLISKPNADQEASLQAKLYVPVKVVQEVPAENIIIVKDDMDQVPIAGSLDPLDYLIPSQFCHLHRVHARLTS